MYFIFDFIFQKCLDKDPARRWSCEQLLHHNFFKQHSFKIPNYEESERGRVNIFFENKRFPKYLFLKNKIIFSEREQQRLQHVPTPEQGVLAQREPRHEVKEIHLP